LGRGAEKLIFMAQEHPNSLPISPLMLPLLPKPGEKYFYPY